MKSRNHEIASVLVVIVFLLVPFSCVIFKLVDRLANTTGVRTGKEKPFMSHTQAILSPE